MSPLVLNRPPKEREKTNGGDTDKVLTTGTKGGQPDKSRLHPYRHRHRGTVRHKKTRNVIRGVLVAIGFSEVRVPTLDFASVSLLKLIACDPVNIYI